MTESEGTKKTILIVDDEPSVITYLEALLEDNGYATVSAMDGQEGLEVARNERPDLITLDITMPKKSGVSMYRALREDDELKSIPIIIVTAVTGYAGKPEEFEKFLSTRRKIDPPDGFVAKPIDRDELISLLEKVLA